MPKTSKRDPKKKTKHKNLKKVDPKNSENQKSKDLDEQLKVKDSVMNSKILRKRMLPLLA